MSVIYIPRAVLNSQTASTMRFIHVIWQRDILHIKKIDPITYHKHCRRQSCTENILKDFFEGAWIFY